jgi:hypothetical protein
MSRVVVVVAGCLALAGCSTFSPGDWMPSFSLGGGGGGVPLTLNSNPPGADARTSLGQACRTPCTVAVPAREDFTVTFALAGFETQTVPVSVQRAAALGSNPEFSAADPFAPNPVAVELEPATAPPVAKKKPAKPKPRSTATTSPPGAATGGSAPRGTAPGSAAPSSGVPPSQRTIPGAQPTAPPASAWPPPR